MTDIDTVVYSDIKRKGADFTFTGKLADFARNQTWKDAYEEMVSGHKDASGLTTVWSALSSGAEDAGNTIYTTIKNYIDEIGNIDTCGIKQLREYSKILGCDSEYLNSVIEFPIEIQNLIEIFSVNKAYLYNKATDGNSDNLVLSNTILHYSTIEQFLDAFKDVDKFNELVHNSFYNTLMEFLNLKNVTFDDSIHGIETIEIWKKDINRFTNKLWSDDIESDFDVYSLKKSLSIDKSFTEKIYADDIISGKRKITDFTESEQIVINAEIESRKTRYGDNSSLRYYYTRMYKVIEYFRFCTSVYNNVYTLTEYDLDNTKYTIESSETDNNILKYNYDTYEINTTLIRKVSSWLTDYTFNLQKLRTTMKSQCQRNMMTGTKRLIVDIVKKFILDKIDSETWTDVSNSILKNSNLNRNFDIDIIEYIDTTDYYNIENTNDSVSPVEHTLRPRYWEYNDLHNAIDFKSELDFSNKLVGDGRKYDENEVFGNYKNNLNEFLSILFESGATSNTNSDFYLSSDVYNTVDGTEVKKVTQESISDTAKEIIQKYTGDINIGTAPYANDKNTFHPSYQVYPFLRAFEEYSSVYSSIVNLVNSFSENIQESVRRLSKRIDSLGNTINFWYNWNDDFSGYTTTYEKNSINAYKNDQKDSPFNFRALNELLNFKNEYISNILHGINEYYFDSTTGKPLLDENESRIEIARLQKYFDKIKLISEKEIYKYGKDYNGNIYILYKDAGNRNEKNALGDIWVRLKNHPIAFPLFDLAMSPVRFNDSSCLSETDNNKLIEVLTTIISYFHETYGRNNIEKVHDGNVVPNNICLTYGDYSSTLPVLTNSRGASSEPVFEYEYDDFNFSTNPKLSLVHTLNSELNSYVGNYMKFKTLYKVDEQSPISDYRKTYYFIDSVTNKIIDSDIKNTIKIYAEDKDGNRTEVKNEIGKIISAPDSTYFHADYDNMENTFEIASNNGMVNDELLFANYTDENKVDDGITYYCEDMSLSSGEFHPCTKHEIILNSLFKLDNSALSGNVDEIGNVHFGGDIDYSKIAQKNVYSNYDTRTFTETTSSIVDGGLVYEDFDNYTYKYKNPETEEEEYVDRRDIVLLGGCNPYYVYYDKNDEMQLEEATIESGYVASDVYKFGDNIYRTGFSSHWVSSFPLSDCVLKSRYESEYTDSFGQFYLRSNPYVLYHPYTKISGHPYTTQKSSPENPVGKITLVDKFGNDKTFYYDIETLETKSGVNSHVRVKSFEYDRYFKTMEITSTKFNGSFELTPYDISEYSIYLTFNESNENNVATYSSYSMFQDQKKFFDMGFSYNQKMFYMTYYNGSDEYLDSGTIIGKLTETYDENYNPKISYYRDTSHNMEYIDSTSVGVLHKDDISNVFHIGDTPSKKGIITAFGKYKNPKNGVKDDNLEIMLNLITDTNIYEHKFNINLKYPIYDKFETGSKYSFKLSCTIDRAYISFTSDVPSDEDIITNTIDESSTGLGGSVKFEKIKNHFGDSTITILSFDISDNENFLFKEDETRYLMQCGDIGYFGQYSGFLGKNNVFANEMLSADNRFSFEIMYDSLDGDSTELSFYKKYTSKVEGFKSTDISNSFERFINFYDNEDDTTIRGVLISDKHDFAYICTASENNGKTVKLVNYDNNPIYDITRGLDNDIMFIADGVSTNTRAGALVKETTARSPIDVNGLKFVKIPIQTSVDGFYNTDFIQLDDISNGAYAFCSDRKTISKLTICERGDEFVPTSGIVKLAFNPLGILKKLEQLDEIVSPKDGDIYMVEEGNYSFPPNTTFIRKNGKWNVCSIENLEPTEIRSTTVYVDKILKEGYSESSENGGKRYFSTHSGENLLYLNAYDKYNIIVKSQNIEQLYTYKSISYFVGNIPYKMEYDRIVEENGIKTVFYGIYKIDELGNSTKSNEVGLNYDDPILGIVNTTVDSEKMIYTRRGGIYLYRVGTNILELSHTFDDFSTEISLYDYDMDVKMHETENHILISFYVEKLETGWVLYARKNTPNSKAMKTSIFGYNGISIESIRTNKIISCGKTVIMNDLEENILYISKDDGITFNILKESTKNKMNIVGCTSRCFYARYENGEKIYSENGETWKNEKRVPLSDWCVFNANNIDYIGCEKYDESLVDGSIDYSYYINVDKQFSLSGDYPYDAIINNGNVLVCYSGIDGSHPFSIARTTNIMNGFEYFTFEYAKGFAYNKAICYDKDLILAPDGGMNVMIIKNALDSELTPYVSYINIDQTMNNSTSIFNGFEYSNGNILMYPSDGDRLLAYNHGKGMFYNYYSFGQQKKFSDMDSIDGNINSDSILSPKSISTDGTIEFIKTNFDSGSNYGIVEIDEGFPILITYSVANTKFSNNGKYYPINVITFTFMNDVNKKSVTIMSKPKVSQDETDYEYIMNLISKESEKSAVYVSGNTSVCYKFTSKSDGLKYDIEKIYKREKTALELSEYFTLTYGLQSMDDRNRTYVDYDGYGAISIYDDFEKDDYVIYLSQPDDDSTEFDIFIKEAQIKDDMFTFKMRVSVNNGESVRVLWGDGYNEYFTNTKYGDNELFEIEHVYEGSGDYKIRIGNSANSFRTGETDEENESKKTITTIVKYSSELNSADSLFMNCKNLTGDIPQWGSSITNAHATYKNCISLDAASIPEWNDEMTDISECYDGCYNIGRI